MNTYIIDGARTAFGTFGGSLKDVSEIDLGVTATTEAISQLKILTKSYSVTSFTRIKIQHIWPDI